MTDLFSGKACYKLVMEINKADKHSKPNIFDFMNFRDYLAAYYDYEKETNPKFSYGSFALKAQIKTRNYLKRVIDGERPLSQENLPKFSIALNLDAQRALYFETMVQYNQAKDRSIKNHYFQQLQQIAEDITDAKVRISAHQYKVFQKWYYLSVYELLTINSLKANPALISKHLNNLISPTEVKEAFGVLESAKMIEKDESTGQYVKSSKKVTYSEDVVNLAVQNYHRTMLRLTDKLIEEEEDINRRYLRALTLVVPSNKESEVRDKVDLFFKALNKSYSEKNRDTGTLIQLNSQLLTLTKNINIEE